MSDNVGRYVGLRQGKYWERTENSDYYCGGCGWEVTDHDSYCPECGGALHKSALGGDTCKVDVLNTGDCAGYECSEYIMHCNACGHEFGHVLYNEDGDVWMSEPPRFCPHCGRKVVDA